MRMNPIPTIIITGALIMQSVVPSFAQNVDSKRLINDVDRWQNQASKAAGRQQNELQNIVRRADTLINNRLNSLNVLNSRIQNDSRLSASEKSILSSEIQADINGLTALKAKIDADTDAATARNDAKQIITNYHIYAIFEPKIRLLIVLNNLEAVSANMQALVPQIQNLINTFQSQGKDVSQLQALLNNVSSQLKTINTTLTTDITIVQNVSSASEASSAEKTFVQVRQDIAQIVRSGFAKIRADFAQMKEIFHQLIFIKPFISSSPSASQTATVTTTP